MSGTDCLVGPGTAVKGIDLLWPGRLIELDGAGKELRQEDFWRIPDRAPDPTMDEDAWRLCYRRA